MQRQLIVGGAEASPAYPFLGSLQRFSSHTCGATLIAPEWAITAAHCVVGSNGRPVKPSLLRLMHHEADLRDGGRLSTCGGYAEVAESITHPALSDVTFENDVALLRLTVGLSAACAQDLPRLDGSPSAAGAGVEVVVAGWGRTSLEEAVETYPMKMHSVRLPIVSNAECNEAYRGSIYPGILCAGVAQGGVDSCQGDSGGPLFTDGEVRTLVGVVSWGSGCGDAGYPGVYTRVSHYHGWITEQMDTTTPPSPPPAPPPTPPSAPPAPSPPPLPPAPPASPALPEGEACACTSDGVSGGVDTGTAGCDAWLGDGITWCYVAEPEHCSTASASAAFNGAGWASCSLVPSQDAWGACECAEDAFSNNVATGTSSCGNPNKDPNGAWCYVSDSDACTGLAVDSNAYPGAAWAYCPLETYTRCTDDPDYQDTYGGCAGWVDYACTTAHINPSTFGWTEGGRDWLVYSCPESCADVEPDCSGRDHDLDYGYDYDYANEQGAALSYNRYTVSSVLTIAGDVASFDKREFRRGYAALVGVSSSDVALEVRAGSVVASTTVVLTSQQRAVEAAAVLSLLTRASASSALGVSVLDIYRAASVVTTGVPPPPPPGARASLPPWAMLIVFSSIAFAFAVGVYSFTVYRRKRARTGGLPHHRAHTHPVSSNNSTIALATASAAQIQARPATSPTQYGTWSAQPLVITGVPVFGVPVGHDQPVTDGVRVAQAYEVSHM